MAANETVKVPIYIVFLGLGGMGKSSLIRKLLLNAGTLPANTDSLLGVSKKLCIEYQGRRLILIDTPCSHTSIDNVIKGMVQADYAVFVTGSEQPDLESFTFAHFNRELELCDAFSLEHGLVLLSKCDEGINPLAFKAVERAVDATILTSDRTILPFSSLENKMFVDNKDCHLNGLLDILSKIPSIVGNPLVKFRLPVMHFDKEKNVANGRVVSGSCESGCKLMLMPQKIEIEVILLHTFGKEARVAQAGDDVEIQLKGNYDINPGSTLCDVNEICNIASIFDAKIYVVPIDPGKFEVGETFKFHFLGSIKEAKVVKIYKVYQKVSQRLIYDYQRDGVCNVIEGGQHAEVRIELEEMICIEKYEDFKCFGQFVITKGRGLARGHVTELINPKLDESRSQ